MNEDMGAIGIGAMIVFIALILVAAVASAVIIQTGEKLQQNAQQTGDDTREEIGGKISIITAWVGDTDDCDGADTAADVCITLVFELAAGSEPIEESDVIWTIICDGGAGTMATIQGNFDDNDGVGDTTVGSDTRNVDDSATADDTLDPGQVYMIDLKTATDTNDVPASVDCFPASVGVENTLIISVEGGGTTYETLSFTSLTEGEAIV